MMTFEKSDSNIYPCAQLPIVSELRQADKEMNSLVL